MRQTKPWWFPFFAALLLGVLLHFLYGWVPTSLTALISPVRESLWEHVKILFWPLLLAGLWITGSHKGGLTPWLAANLTVNALMLLLGYLWNVTFQLDGSVFNIALYVVMVILAFLLVPVYQKSLETKLTLPIWLVTLGLVMALVCFTFSPPNGVLFADLSGEVRTFFTIPV